MNNVRTRSADTLDEVAAYFAKFETMSAPSESAWEAAIRVDEAKSSRAGKKTVDKSGSAGQKPVDSPAHGLIICAVCKAEKPKAEFRTYCKPCARARAVAEGLVRNESQYEKRRAYLKERYQANKDHIRAQTKAWRESNPGKSSEYSRNRHARKVGAKGSHTAADIQAIFTAQAGLCANCNTHLFKSGKQKYHVDHIMPLALGGSNWPANLQCLCPTCNLRKGATHPDVWAKEQGRLL